MKILITGINGFIGKCVAKLLLQQGHSVVGLGKDKLCQVDGPVDYIQGDVLDLKSIRKAMIGVEIVIHLAALTAHQYIIDNKFKTLEINFIGTKNILDEFYNSPTTKKLIWSSTGKVYGEISSLPITENHDTKPKNILGKSKLITEQLINFYCSNDKSLIIFRIFNVYGPEQKSNFLIPTILTQLETSSSLTLGDVNARRDYIFIDDVSQAFLQAVTTDLPKGLSIFNVCSGTALSAKEIVEEIAHLSQRQIKLTVNPNLIRADEMPVEFGSYQKIKTELGWQPTFSLLDGLKKTMETDSRFKFKQVLRSNMNDQ